MTQSLTPKPKSRQVIGHWSLDIGLCSFVICHLSFVIPLLLLTWGLRLCYLETVPPGWRDDELINIHALSGELLEGRFPLYFAGASGHEPLYHYLHAGVHAVLGFNVLSGHLLSVALGTLTVALTYALAHRLFGRTTAAIASLALATSFWSLMYSRMALRHINLPPLALTAFYIFWLSPTTRHPPSTLHSPSSILHPPPAHPSFDARRSIPLGIIIGLSFYTYPASRVIPVLLVLFGAYLALFHRDEFNRRWRGLALALVVTAVLAIPLGFVLAQGAGADARLAELAVPLQELRAGNARPLIDSIWTTLGMFHATGDPEWLYNIPDRPVFNLLGGALLWTGVVLCLCRWRQPRYFFLLLWLGLGLLPAFPSVPPASLSHTILAQPVAYILPALMLTEAYRWLESKIPNQKSQNPTPNTSTPNPQSPSPILHSPFSILRSPFSILYSLFSILSSLLSPLRRWSPAVARFSFVVLSVVFLATNAVRDLRDYFVTWPERGMVRFLWRADYREAAGYLNTHAEITDVAIASTLMGPWDRLALEVDARRDDVTVRLFNPERALVWAGEDAPAIVLLASGPRPVAPIDSFLEAEEGLPGTAYPHLRFYTIARGRRPETSTPLARFSNGLELLNVRWVEDEPPTPGQEGVLLAAWSVAAPLELPPLPIIANPPPPGVYSGPRLATFAHLLSADGALIDGDDGFWVDPLTLRPGDTFVQAHRFTLPPDAPPGDYELALGLYDPFTGERWVTLDAMGQPSADSVRLPLTGRGR